MDDFKLIQIINKKIEELKDTNFIKYTFYELRIKYNLTEKEIDRFLELSKNYFEQKGYSVYFTGARYTYNGKTSTVGQNYYMIAIKE